MRKLDYSFKEVHLQPNPFMNLTLMVYPQASCAKGIDPTLHMFVDLCRQKGIERTLKTYFNKKDAIVWEQHLYEHGYTDWFDPEEVWKGISIAMKTILNPPNIGPITNKVIGSEVLMICE